jgi:hypothetical protein
LELSINNSEGLDIVLLSSFVLFLGDLGKAEHSVDGAWVIGAELSVLEFKPLIDLGSLEGIVSVEFSSLASKETENGGRFEDAAFRSLKSGHLAEGMLGEVFSRFPLVPGETHKLDLDVDEPEKQLNLGTSSGVVLGRVQLVSHLLKILYQIKEMTAINIIKC